MPNISIKLSKERFPTHLLDTKEHMLAAADSASWNVRDLLFLNEKKICLRSLPDLSISSQT